MERRKEKIIKRRPNLFDFATAESAQDALFCWILDFINNKYEKYQNNYEGSYNVAQNFLKLLYGDEERDFSEIQAMEIKKQYWNMDIVVIIKYKKNTDIIIIEDKKFTFESSGQLTRYRKIIETEKRFITDMKITDAGTIRFYPVFISTGYNTDEFDISEPDFFRKIGRDKLLEVLDGYYKINVLLTDFINHLKEIDFESSKYKNEAVKNWSSKAWMGFAGNVYANKEKLGLREVEYNYFINRNYPSYMKITWSVENKEESEIKKSFVDKTDKNTELLLSIKGFTASNKEEYENKMLFCMKNKNMTDSILGDKENPIKNYMKLNEKIKRNNVIFCHNDIFYLAYMPIDGNMKYEDLQDLIKNPKEKLKNL